MGFITSAGGILALLDEPEDTLKVFALRRLNEITEQFWPEISDSIHKIELLYEDEKFSEKELAALVASKVYFHLGSYLDSLTYALGAGHLLDQESNVLYIDTIKVQAIDHYIKLRNDSSAKMDARLEALLDRMFERCMTDKQYRHAIGIALETHRMDWFRSAIAQSDDLIGCVTYAYKIAMQYMEQRSFRNRVLEELVSLYCGLATPDYVNMCQCLIHLDQPRQVANILDKLIRDDKLKSDAMDNELMAYQIGFDLYESATQDLLQHVMAGLRAAAPIPGLLRPAHTKHEPPTTTTSSSATPEPTSASSTPAAPATPVSGGTPASGGEQQQEGGEEEESSEKQEERNIDELSDVEKLHQSRVEKLTWILSGEKTIELNLQFLIANNKTDALVLKNTKEAVRVSVCHTATVIANSFMYCGTTSDVFLRDNLEWLSRATNWAKMTATASLGVIHRGHEKEVLKLMQSYLPKDSSGSGYVESGSLFALGLIHANHGAGIIDYLLTQLKEAQSEIVRHGGCLGLGLAAMGTQRADVYEQLKYALYQDDAVTGEAAGLAMGLVMLGSASTRAVRDMVSYARETQHEKIVRGLAVGTALTMYGVDDLAEDLIAELMDDKDAILRRAAMYTLALAYCGTASTSAMRRLLHVAVSDVDNDVRRAAVEGLGLLLFRAPEQIPSMVSLLAESYNPHVRYGAALALGIACSGTGSKDAIGLLEPLTNDSVNFVRQGALVASALILIQQTEALCPKVKDFRQLYAKVVADKHEDSIAKFGAILAQGIIDAGGRNATISLQSRTGHTSMTSVVGVFVFTQFWYWFPCTLFLSLAFTPTSLIGLNADLKMPKMQFTSNAKPSTYGYPAPLEEKKKETAEKVTAVLSITAKAKKKEAEKKKDQKEEKMEVDEKDKEEKKDEKKPKEEEKKTKSKDEKEEKEKKDEKDKEKDKEKEKKDEKDKKEDEKKKEEPAFDTLTNPARVMKQQLKVIRLPEGSRYAPVKDSSIGGVLLLRDTRPADEEDLVMPVEAHGPRPQADLSEPEPPQPFEFVDED